MSEKTLKDFTVEINCEGWKTREQPSYYRGQRFSGSDITARMIQALVDKDTFVEKPSGEVKQVCSIVGGGSIPELELLYSGKTLNKIKPVEKPVEKMIEKPIQKPIEKVVETDDDDDEDEEKKPKRGAPVRKPRS